MHPADAAEPPPLPPAEHVRRLVEANRITEARRYVEEFAQGDTTVESWAKLLRPPRVTTSPRTAHSDFGADYVWLRANREAFLGRWVALRDGKLLDTDLQLRPLVDRLTERGAIEGAFVVQVD